MAQIAGLDWARDRKSDSTLGLIPGIGAIVPTFMAYVAEKRLSKNA